jgi:vacuolar-type H+-ATPase subunit C/Vma6
MGMTVLAATNFDYLNAKLHGLHSRLLTGARLDDLAHRRTPSEVASAVLGEAMSGDAAALERHLTAAHVRALAQIAQEMHGAERRFFAALLERYRIENLKVVIRWRAAPEPVTSPAHLLVPLPERLEIPAEHLMAAPDVPSLIEALPEERYVAAAQRGLEHFHQTGSAFYVEAALDRQMFADVRAAQVALRRPHRQAVAGLLGRERDVYNVLFVARAAQTYKLPFEGLVEFLAPNGWASSAKEAGRAAVERAGPRRDLTLDLLARVHAAPTPGTIREALRGAMLPPEAAEPASSEADDLAALERRLWTGLARLANRVFFASVFTLGMAAAFYYLKRVELFNVLRVVEGVRYGMTPEEIGEDLIRPAAE